MRQTYYLATYYDDGQTIAARFTSYEDAVAHCARIAGRYSVDLFLTRGKGQGIIGQWHNGLVTPEFFGRDLPNATCVAVS